ncbi:hypothetical protein P7C73_g4751, partial [Tremellales sp. Uapishka_1]
MTLLPTTLLPPLPRSQYTLSPLAPSLLLDHIAILKEMYIPPVHGGLRVHVSGLGLEDEDEDELESGYSTPAYLDTFERGWAEKWLGGVIRRCYHILEGEGESELSGDEEMILREATAVLAMMAGTSAAGGLTRHLLFPIPDDLARHLPEIEKRIDHSPTTNRFLDSLSTSPTSPISPIRALHAHGEAPPERLSQKPRRRRKPAIPILLHDAPMSDHLSVGVQTWGSAILLGREIALRPEAYGLVPRCRVLELGAGTGLLAILCRKLMDLFPSQDEVHGEGSGGEGDGGVVLATDFLDSVLDNLQVCVDLNFPSGSNGQDDGVEILKLDWTDFPSETHTLREREMLQIPFDLVIASDCVYDPTHAELLRRVVGRVLRLPTGGDQGGTFVSLTLREECWRVADEIHPDH